MKNLIAFRRANKIVCDDAAAMELTAERFQKLSTINKELKVFGYALTPKAMMHISDECMVEIHKDILPYLNSLYGTGHDFRSLYPNFPDSVLSIEETSYYVIQKAIYDGDIDISEFMDSLYKNYVKKESTLSKPIKGIDVMSEKEFMSIPTNIMLTGVSLDKETRNDLNWFLDTYPNLEIPEIPFKETLCLVMKKRPNLEVSTVTDVLRYGLYMMGADPALLTIKKMVNENAWSRKKFKNPLWRNLKSFHRSDRRDIANRLEKTIERKGLYQSILDGKKNYGHWMLLAERLHPSDYKENFSNVTEFFDCLLGKKSKEFKTWEAKIQNMYDSGKDVVEIAKEVAKRPGEFVRRFDSLFRRALSENKHQEIMDLFLETKGKKSKTLLELSNYYDRRGKSPRMISLKESSRKINLPDLDPYSDTINDTIKSCIQMSILDNISDKVKEQDLLGKTVYLDPEIKRVPVAIDMRNSTCLISRGTKQKFSGNIMRFFVHWIQNGRHSEDLDLVACFCNPEIEKTEFISWNRGYKLGNGYGVHSGDVLNRPGDCAEYVDIDVEGALAAGFTHVMMVVYNYKGRGLNTLPAWYGYATRKEMKGGDENWKPENVDFIQKATATTEAAAAWVVDLKEKTAIATDSELKGTCVSGGTEDMMLRLIKYFTTKLSFSSYDVLSRNLEARGANIVNEIPTKTEDDGTVVELVDEKISMNDINLDYTKVTSLL